MTKTIKYITALLLAVLTMAGLAACSSDGDDVEKVSLSVELTDPADTRCTFSINTFMCAKVAWAVLPATEKAPSAADVLSGGTQEEPNTTATSTVTGLAPQTAYKLYVAAQGHFGRTLLKTVDFTTTERGVTKLTQVAAAAYTDKTDAGLYTLTLSTGDTDTYGYPAEVGGLSVMLDLYAAVDTDPTNAVLPDGEYTMGQHTPGTFDPSYSYVINKVAEGNTNDSYSEAAMIGGKVKVSHEGDTYTIEIDAVTHDGGEVFASYQGPIAFTLNASTEYKPFTEAQDVTLELEQGRYWGNWFYPHADDFALQFFTGTFDANGNQTDGYYLYVPGYMPKLADYNTTSPQVAEGTYDITPRKSTNINWIPFEVQQGELMEFMGSSTPVGIYLTRIDASTGKRYLSVIVSGTVTFKKNGSGYTVTVEGKSAEGVSIKCRYDGTIAMTNYCDNDTNPQTPKRPWSSLSADHTLSFNSTTEASIFFMGEDLKRGLNSWIVMLAADPLKDDYITLELLTDTSEGTDFPSRTYTLSMDLKANNALPGFQKYGGGEVVYSWYGDMNDLDDEGYANTLAPLNSGTITVKENSRNDDTGNYTITFNTKDDAGHAIKGTFTGPASFYDARQQASVKGYASARRLMKSTARRMARK